MYIDSLDTYYLPYYKSQVKEQTYENRLSSILVHFKFFYHYTIDDIKPRHIGRWRNKLMETGKSSYVRSIQGQLSLLFEHAITLEYCSDNPSRALKNVKKTKAKIEFWTKDEFEKVMKTFYTEDFYQHYCFIIIYLLFMTGLRIGEASALQWSNIDFEKSTLEVNKSLIYKNRKEFYFGETKTKAGNRIMALDECTLCFLKEWKKRQESLLKSEFVLSYNGLPTTKGSVARIIKRHSELAEIKKITTHALRHSHASFLIMLGENPLIIRDRLGHEDIETTLGTYGHLYPNTNIEVAQRLNKSISITTSEKDVTIKYAKNQFTANNYISENVKQTRKKCETRKKQKKNPLLRDFFYSFSTPTLI